MNRLRTSSTRNSLVPEALQMRGKSMQRMFTRRRRSVVGEDFFLFHCTVKFTLYKMCTDVGFGNIEVSRN